MKNLIKKYGGAIFFYGAIIGMILLVNARFDYLNEIKENNQVVALAE